MKTFAMIEEVGGQHETVSGFGIVLLLSTIHLFRHSTNKPSAKIQRAGCNAVVSSSGWSHPSATLIKWHQTKGLDERINFIDLLLNGLSKGDTGGTS